MSTRSFWSPLAGSALASLVWAPQAHANADLERYVASGYVYCDAVVMGQFWGQTPAQAKARMGRMLTLAQNMQLDGAVGQARLNGHRCGFADTGFSYADAVALARVWGVEVAEAKSALVDKVSNGFQDLAVQVVRDAHAGKGGVVDEDEDVEEGDDSGIDEETAALRFTNAGYQYCDAVVLGNYWGWEVWDAKVAAGRMLSEGQANALARDVRAARQQGHRCSFDDTGLSYDDAEAVAALWGVDVDDAKAALADKYSTGYVALAHQVVAEAHSQ